MIVSGSSDGTLYLWNLQGQSISEPFQAHNQEVNSIAIALSPDGYKIVTASKDQKVYLWNIQGKLIHQIFQGSKFFIEIYSGRGGDEAIIEHELYIKSVAFSPNGQMIVGGSNFIKTYSSLRSPRSPRNPSNSNSSLAKVYLWDLQGNLIVEEAFPHEDEYGVDLVAFSQDGHTIVSQSWNTPKIRLWNLQGKLLEEKIWKKSRTDSSILSFAFSPDYQLLVSGGYYNTLGLWNLKYGNLIWNLWGSQLISEPIRADNYKIDAVALSPDDQKIVIANNDKSLHLWNLQGN